MNAVIGWVEWIIRMGGELYHGEIGDVYEMFAVVVALIYREALFNRADVIVLCAPYLGLEGTVAEVAHNHTVFAVLLEARARLHARDSVDIRSGFRGLKNARLLKQAGAEVVVDSFHKPRIIKISIKAKQLSSIKLSIIIQRKIFSKGAISKTDSFRLLSFSKAMLRAFWPT